jgi:hypothetical protein
MGNLPALNEQLHAGDVAFTFTASSTATADTSTTNATINTAFNIEFSLVECVLKVAAYPAM